MTSDEERRFALLQTEWCDFRYINELYGLDLRKEHRFQKHFQAWAQQRKGEAVRSDETVHRYRFETFLQTQKLLTRKWGALRLGMKPASLDLLLNSLNDRGLVFSYYPSEERNQFVGEKIDYDVLGLIDEFRFRTFTNHNNFCFRMHQAIEQNFGIKVEPEFDITCQFLTNDEKEWDYAHDWDAITLDAVSLEFQVWLDLGKPMNLRPDCCSKLFYVRERDRLKDYVVGTGEPDIPSELFKAVAQKKAGG